MSKTPATATATATDTAKKDPNFDLLAALALFASNPSTEADASKLEVPPQLNADDERIYAYVCSTWTTGDASLAWRVKHAEMAAGIRAIAWTLAKIKIWNLAPVPSGVREAESETRRLLAERRTLAVSQRREEQFDRLLAGLAPALGAFVQFVEVMEPVCLARIGEHAGLEAAKAAHDSANKARIALFEGMKAKVTKAEDKRIEVESTEALPAPAPEAEAPAEAPAEAEAKAEAKAEKATA